jgi:hypothetical protein
MDRAGQTWRLADLIFLVVETQCGLGPDAHHSWHRCVLLDDLRWPGNAGKLDIFVEKPHDPWEHDNDEPSWERVA